MSQISKNDIAWEKLFAKYRILEEIRQSGVFRISATQINEFREARLMTKFDHRVNLPKVFQDDDLCILPDSRGTYLIGQFEVYQEVPPNYLVEHDEFQLPPHIETIDHTNLYSEASTDCPCLGRLDSKFVPYCIKWLNLICFEVLVCQLTFNFPQTYQENLTRAIEILQQGGCTEVYLFGSLASGKFHQHSDIDLAVRGCPSGNFLRYLASC